MIQPIRVIRKIITRKIIKLMIARQTCAAYIPMALIPGRNASSTQGTPTTDWEIIITGTMIIVTKVVVEEIITIETIIVTGTITGLGIITMGIMIITQALNVRVTGSQGTQGFQSSLVAANIAAQQRIDLL